MTTALTDLFYSHIRVPDSDSLTAKTVPLHSSRWTVQTKTEKWIQPRRNATLLAELISVRDGLWDISFSDGSVFAYDDVCDLISHFALS